jgi:hypothetical protein
MARDIGLLTLAAIAQPVTRNAPAESLVFLEMGR